MLEGRRDFAHGPAHGGPGGAEPAHGRRRYPRRAGGADGAGGGPKGSTAGGERLQGPRRANGRREADAAGRYGEGHGEGDGPDGRSRQDAVRDEQAADRCARRRREDAAEVTSAGDPVDNGHGSERRGGRPPRHLLPAAKDADGQFAVLLFFRHAHDGRHRGLHRELGRDLALDRLVDVARPQRALIRHPGGAGDLDHKIDALRRDLLVLRDERDRAAGEEKTRQEDRRRASPHGGFSSSLSGEGLLLRRQDIPGAHQNLLIAMAFDNGTRMGRRALLGRVIGAAGGLALDGWIAPRGSGGSAAAADAPVPVAFWHANSGPLGTILSDLAGQFNASHPTYRLQPE